MKRWISVLTLCIVGMAATDPVGADPLAPLEYQVLESAINDDSLDKMTKISRIGEFFKADPNCHQAWMWVARVDESFAAKGLKREFKNPKRDQQEKLTIGRTLLSDQRFNGDKEFIDEYAPWLIDQVVAQETNIKQVLVESQLTPVGEYANIANGFQGHSVENFSKIKDKRVIPVLIAALEMPDTVYGEHNRGGKPGEGTRRNVDRQNVPIALAKLGAANSVPALRRTLETHHDWYLRDNSALALAMLLDPAQREELVGWMEKRMADDYKLDRFRHLFAFGKGLLNSGDDAGVEFMAFEYSIYHNNPKLSEVTYMLEERLNLLRGLRSDKLAEFYNQLFQYQPLVAVFMFDKDSVQINDYGHTKYDLATAEMRIIRLFDETAKSIETNNLTKLREHLQNVSGKTAKKAIRLRADSCIRKLEGIR